MDGDATWMWSRKARDAGLFKNASSMRQVDKRRDCSRRALGEGMG